MAFSLRDLFFQNWGGSQVSESRLSMAKSSVHSAVAVSPAENDDHWKRPRASKRHFLYSLIFLNNRKGGTTSLLSRTCVERNAMFVARFKGLSLYFLCQKGNLVRIKTGLDTIGDKKITYLVLIPDEFF